MPRDRSPHFFILVGCAAALVHWCVVVALVSGAGWRPLAANAIGWAVAFGVSFAGHHRLTFRAHGVPLRAALLRFLALSAGGFAINEAAYAVLLGLGLGAGYQWILAFVLLAVAALTWWLSRRWAFAHPGSRAR